VILAVVINSGDKKEKKPESVPTYKPSYSTPSPKPSATATPVKTEPAEDESEPDTEEEQNQPEEEISESSENDSDNGLSLSDIKAAIENGDFSFVDPHFKAMMDGYESFYDDYIAFMNKYNSDDADSLSPADHAYYLLVTMRIEKKHIGSAY